MKIVKPRDEEIDLVLSRAHLVMNSRATVGEPVEKAFHMEVKQLLSKRQQGYVMGAFRDTVAHQSAAYAEGVLAAVEWMMHGGPPPLGDE